LRLGEHPGSSGLPNSTWEVRRVEQKIFEIRLKINPSESTFSEKSYLVVNGLPIDDSVKGVSDKIHFREVLLAESVLPLRIAIPTLVSVLLLSSLLFCIFWGRRRQKLTEMEPRSLINHTGGTTYLQPKGLLYEGRPLPDIPDHCGNYYSTIGSRQTWKTNRTNHSAVNQNYVCGATCGEEDPFPPNYNSVYPSRNPTLPPKTVHYNTLIRD